MPPILGGANRPGNHHIDQSDPKCKDSGYSGGMRRLSYANCSEWVSINSDISIDRHDYKDVVRRVVALHNQSR